MFQKSKIINLSSIILIAFAAFILISDLLISRYEHGLLVAGAIAVLIVVIAFITDKLIPQNIVLSLSYFHIIGIIILLFGISFLPELIGIYPFYQIHPAELWLNKYISDVYPYWYDGTIPAFPVYYTFLLPFYLFDAIQIFPIVGIAFFITLLLKFTEDAKNLLFRLYFFLFSVVLFYEQLTGYYVILFALIAVGMILLGGNELYYEKKILILFFVAPVWGLLLAVWQVLWIPFFFFVVFHFKQHIRYGLLFTFIVFLTFLLFISPYVLPNPDGFIKFGPFNVLLFDLSYWILIPFIVSMIYVAFIVSDVQEMLFVSGIYSLLFGIFPIISSYQEIGIYALKHGDVCNPTFFIASVIFLIFSLKDYTVDTYLGKVLQIE